MLSKDEIAAIVEDYDRMKLRIGMTASHSALDICDGAIEEGFPTVAYCKEGRHKTYANYFKAQRSQSGRVVRGMVDKAIVMPSFNDVMKADMQEQMRKRNVVYIPNRSFTSYSTIEDVENTLKGHFSVQETCFEWKSVLKNKITTDSDKAGLPYPEAIPDPKTSIVWSSSNCITLEEVGTGILHMCILCRISGEISGTSCRRRHR